MHKFYNKNEVNKTIDTKASPEQYSAKLLYKQNARKKNILQHSIKAALCSLYSDIFRIQYIYIVIQCN